MAACSCHNGCGTCGGGCTGSATSGSCSCGSSCGSTCVGTSTGASCSSCGSDCGGSCSSCASGNSSGWGSEDGGGGGCSCGGDCSGGCSGSCEATCDAACDTGCTTTTAVDLYNKLLAGLNKKILAADLQNINQMIQLESQRRGKSTTSQTFSIRDKATSTKIKALQSNLSQIGFKTSQSAEQKIKSFKATGQELIDKALDAYKTEIKHS